MTRIPQLQDQLVMAAARQPDRRRLRLPGFGGRRRYLAVALAALVVAGGSAGAARLVIHEGAPIKPAPAADFTPDHHMVPPIRGTERIVTTVPNPGGGLRWGLRVSQGKQGTICTGIGQVLHGNLGVIDSKGVFHRLPLLGPDTCNKPVKSDEVGWGASGVMRPGSHLAVVPNRPIKDSWFVVYGTAGGQVDRIAVAARGKRHVMKPADQGAFIAVIPGPVSIYDITLTAHFRDGSVQTFGGRERDRSPDVRFHVTPSGAGAQTTFTVTFKPPYKVDDPRDSYRATFYMPRPCAHRLGSGQVAVPAADPVRFQLDPGPSQGWCPGRYKGAVQFLDFRPGVQCSQRQLADGTCSRERPVGRFFTFRVE
jgi:hypothetical protein